MTEGLTTDRRTRRSQLRDLPLAQKMTIPFSVFIAGISLFVYFYLPVQYDRQATRAIAEKMRSITSITTFGVAPAFVFGDSAAFQETIEQLRQDPQIRFVVFTDRHGRVLAAHGLDAAERAGFRSVDYRNGISPDGQYFLAHQTVTSQQDTLGGLDIGMSLSQLQSDATGTRIIVALASTLFFIIGVIVVFAISTLVTKPLAQMARTAETITAGDLSLRAPEVSQDEVGHLAAAFNMMLDRLHSTYTELETQNQQLELRVTERTWELEREVEVRVQSEAALRESEVFLHNSQKVAHLGSYIIDRETGSWKSSAILDAILGIDETYSRTVEGMAALIHPDSRADFLRAVSNAVNTTRRLDHKYLIIRLNDHIERWVHILGEFETDSAGRRRVLGTVQDITDSITLERQLLQAQKLEGIGTLAGGIAHDFNNLLSMILGSAELLRMHMQGNPKVLKQVDRIVNASERGASISRQLLIFSRPDESELKPVSIREIITELKQMLSHFLPKSITIETQADVREAMVMGDAGQIHQALLNLVLNANDAMSNNGRLTLGLHILEASALPRKFDPVDASRYAAISVADTGEGMSDSTMQKIFEPFFSTKPQGKGTGLGLAMVHGIVKHHKGFIDVASTLGRGTTFTIYIPATAENTSLLPAPEAEMTTKDSGTVLLVDDEHMIREMLTEYLEECGFTVITAHNGREGLAQHSISGPEIDIVLTDLGMPEMGGEEFLRKLKVIDPHLPVLVSSGYLDGISRESLMKLGALDVLTKPYRFDQIRKILRECIARKTRG